MGRVEGYEPTLGTMFLGIPQEAPSLAQLFRIGGFCFVFRCSLQAME